MSKKMLVGIIISLIICSAVLIQQASSETNPQPTKLKIYVGPTSVPADNGTYGCIFIQLQDSFGNPARAQETTAISLSSSVTEIGTVDSPITIQKGSTYASANFYSTFTPGTTSITATATGYGTVQAPVTTIGPKPYTIAVYGFPPTLPADGRSFDNIMVQLQDSEGSPAKAPRGGTGVTLSSSNINVGDVTQYVTIPEGQTYAIATFTTTSSTGEAVITAIAGDYGSTHTTITTMEYTSVNSGRLTISTGPAKVLAENIAYKQIAVQKIYFDELLGRDFLAVSSSNLAVAIASAEESIGKTETSITIPAGETYALATLTTTYKAGTTTITAVASNYEADNQEITATGFTASKLAVYTVPATLPADKGTYRAVQVQLQDTSGHPAKAPDTDLTVNLFSSQPTVGTVDPKITIPLGKTCATGAVKVTNSPGEFTVTAQASNYLTGQATITTYPLDFSPLDVVVSATPGAVSNGNKSEITAYITAESNPITGATVIFSSDNGGTFTATKAGEAGYYTTTFTAPSFSKTTTCTISANASKSGFLDSSGIAEVAVGPNAVTAQNSNAGVLQLKVQDGSGNFLSDVNVSSIVQPVGVKALSGVTNATGYVTFRNVTAGNYTLELSKAGFETMNQVIAFKGKPLSMSLTLFGGAVQGDNTLWIIITVVVVAVVVAVLSIVLIKRRKKGKPAMAPLKWQSYLES